MNYLTDEDYKIANLNGIDNANAYNRVYACGWDVERAITQPLRRKEDSLWLKYREKAEKIGITQMCFYQRTYKGMTPEQAATTPKIPRKGRVKSNAKISKEVVETAARNGINRKALSQRVYMRRWSVERAMTEPLRSKNRMAKLSEEQVIEIYKRVHNGEKKQKLANEFKVEWQTIHKIKLGEIWSWLTKEIVIDSGGLENVSNG